jgi:tight adherence protein C
MNEIVPRLLGGDLIYLSVLLVVFAGVLALFFGIRSLLAARVDVVKGRVQRAVGGASPASPLASAGTLTVQQRRGFLDQALRPFARVAQPTDEAELGRLRQQLSYAGFRHERAMVVYLSVKVLLCFAFGGLFLYINALRPQTLPYAAGITVILMAIGFYLPNGWLAGRVRSRQREIDRALPDALDLLVTCVEAGLGIDAGLNRVSEEISLSAPLLSQELSHAALEMRAGMTRGEAFRRLAGRTGVEELRNLAAMIVQTEIFGTSVARSLRVQAEAMRIRRTQQAEERAATVSVKLTFPLIFCILPALFVVLMGPAAVRIFRVLFPTLVGQ